MARSHVILRMPLLTALFLAGLIGSGSAVSAAQPGKWTTTVTSTCAGVPGGYAIFVQGNLIAKSGKELYLNGDIHNPLYRVSCTGNASGTGTFTTKQEPVEALLEWYVVNTATGLFVTNCPNRIPRTPIPVTSASSGMCMDAALSYGSTATTITAAR